MIAELLNVDLFTALGLDKVPQGQKDEMNQQMVQVVEERIYTRLLAMLGEEDQKELDTILEADGDVPAFFKSKIPNLDIVVAESIADFKKEMLDMRADFDQGKESQ